MSRVGRKPVSVPGSVKVSVQGREVTVENGQKRLTFEHRPEIAVEFDEQAREFRVTTVGGENPGREARALWGTTRALLQNMVTGVATGYERKLEIVGVGYSAQVKGETLELKVGYANPVAVAIPAGLEVTVANQNQVSVKGSDKQQVGQFAASVRSVRKPEPYNGKGIKYAEEVVRRKQGKVFGS
ncbi:MAG: 50S ribosomal protein L6 [Phycisphaerales bacterium]